MDEVPPILVVEDEPLVRLTIVEALQEGGYTVLEAGNGAAEALYEQFGFRRSRGLVDYYGPGKDGVHMVYDVPPVVVQAFQSASA